MTTYFSRIIKIAALVVFLVIVSGACTSETPTPTTVPLPTATPPPFPKTIDLTRDLRISGSAVITEEDCPQLLEGMAGGVILGVNEQTCEIDESNGTQAEFHVIVPPEYVDYVFTIKISWPDDGVRGLRAVAENKVAQVGLQGMIFWEKNAFAVADNNLFYAARSEPILLTFVPKQSGDHSLLINIPAGMAWDIGSIQLSATPYPQNMLGIAYSPYRDCQSADTSENQPVSENLRSDLYRLTQSATALRTYSSTGVNAEIVPIAVELGIPVYAGAWIDGDVSTDDDEMRGIIETANTQPIQAAIIGNEYYLRHEVPESLGYLLQRIREFKAAHPNTPVATAEIDSFAFNWSNDGIPSIKPEYRPIMDEVDIFLVHIYPFWSYLPVEGGAQFTVDRYLAIKTLLDTTYDGQKRLILGEAGWPALGAPGLSGNSGQSGAAQETSTVFHPEEQRKYMIELLDLAQKNQVDMFFFSAFDELWKTEGVDGAGSSWGYNYTDRTAKFNFSGLLLPPESLPSASQGDVFNPYHESDFTWKEGEYPIYTEWPREPKGKPKGLEETEILSPSYMGDKESLGMYACARQRHSGETAIQIDYQSGGTAGWAGAYWLYPEQNWGINEDGLDLQSAQKLQFWARGAEGGEIVEFVAGGICGEYDGEVPPLCPDSIQPKISTGPIVLSNVWQKYAFDLRNVDRSNLVGAFGFSVSRTYNEHGATFYLDDVVISADAPLASEAVYPAPIGSTFPIYTDFTALDNHYIPSNFMGDGETPGNLMLITNWGQSFHSGQSAIWVQYNGGPQGWAGVYWTDPENNWGQRPGGYDLTGVSKLTFWARSESPYQQLKVLVGGISCFKEKAYPYHDSVCDVVPIPPITLTTEWEQYTVDLSRVNRDWSQLLGGFGIVLNQEGSVYLDDIVYELDK